MRQIAVFLFFLCVPGFLFAQQEFRIETEIKEVSLTDTTLLNQIRTLIREQEKEDTLF